MYLPHLTGLMKKSFSLIYLFMYLFIYWLFSVIKIVVVILTGDCRQFSAGKSSSCSTRALILRAGLSVVVLYGNCSLLTCCFQGCPQY